MHFYNSVRFVCNPCNLGGSGVRLPGAKFDKYETPDYNVPRLVQTTQKLATTSPNTSSCHLQANPTIMILD